MLLTTCWYDIICCFICICACHLPEIWEILLIYFQHEFIPIFFSATLKYKYHNLVISKSSCISLQLIFWIILGSFLIIFLCWNPVQQDIICYLAYTSGSAFLLQEATGNWGVICLLWIKISLFRQSFSSCLKHFSVRETRLDENFHISSVRCSLYLKLSNTKTAGVSWCHGYQNNGDTEIAEPEWTHPPSKVIYTERYDVLGETEKLAYLMKNKGFFKKKSFFFFVFS